MVNGEWHGEGRAAYLPDSPDDHITNITGIPTCNLRIMIDDLSCIGHGRYLLVKGFTEINLLTR